MKIELVGGPLCGLVEDKGQLIDTVIRPYTPCVGQLFSASYQRTESKTGDGHVRYRYVGQRPSCSA